MKTKTKQEKPSGIYSERASVRKRTWKHLVSGEEFARANMPKSYHTRRISK